MSPTTRKHLSCAHRAIGWNNPDVFRTSAFNWGGARPQHNHLALTKPVADIAINTLETILASNKRQKTKLDAIMYYNQEKSRILDHAAKFSLNITMPEYGATPEEMSAYVTRKEGENRIKEDLRIKALKKQQREDKKLFTAWLAGEPVRFPQSFYTRGNDYFTVRGDEIITSQGARCPLGHAVRALRFYTALNGEDWEKNGHRLPVGHFEIDSIISGDVKAGCHYFTAVTIRAFIKTFGKEIGL